MSQGQVSTDLDFARVVASMDRSDRRRRKAAREREITFTDLADEPLAPTPSGWQGPRLHFSHLIGEGSIWDGPPEPFRFCHGRRLGPGEYCLDCERSGRDSLIPSPGLVDTRRDDQPDGLRGGKG